MKDMISYRAIHDVICPVPREILNKWVKEGKVATQKLGESRQHSRLYSKTDAKRCWDEMKDMISYRAIHDAICPVPREILNQWVDEGKVATQKLGESRQHSRLYSKTDVKRCWDEIKDMIPYQSIHDAICPVPRQILNKWVDEGKVATQKLGESKSHSRTFSKTDVKRCWDELENRNSKGTK